MDYTNQHSSKLKSQFFLLRGILVVNNNNNNNVIVVIIIIIIDRYQGSKITIFCLHMCI